MRLLLQVVVSCLIVAGVLWWMWRLPRRDPSLFVAAPYLSFGCVWAGLFAVAGSLLLWLVPYADGLLALVLLLLDPAAVASGLLVLWIYRGDGPTDPLQAATARQHRSQALVGLAMGLVAVVLGYIYVMTHKQLFTPVGM